VSVRLADGICLLVVARFKLAIQADLCLDRPVKPGDDA
jgi:hypothetical protein